MKHTYFRSLTPAMLLVTGFLALQCIETPEEFIAPTSDIQLSIPLTDITRTMDDLFSKDTSTVKPDGLGGYYFEDTQEAAPTAIDSIKVRPQASGAGVEVGVFEVAGIPSAPVTISASSLGFPSGTFPFPGGSGNLPASPVDFSALFDFMAVSSGTLTLTVTNNFPVEMSFAGPVILRNQTDNAQIASFTFAAPIPPNTSASETDDLAGKLVAGNLQIDPVTVNLASSGGSPVTFDANSGMTFDFSSSPILVDSAAAIIPAQQMTSINDSVLVIDDSVTVTRATFSSGGFAARITNNLGISIGVLMQFDNFRNPATNSVLVIEEDIPPNTVRDYPVSLDTVELVDPVPDAIGSRMKFSVGIETINSGGEKSTITKNDFITAEFLPQGDFVLNSVEGRIRPTTVAVNSGASGADLGEAADKFSGTFTFEDVRIAVDLGLSGGFPIGYDLVLWAKNNKTGVEDSLVVPPPQGSTENLVVPGPNQFARIVLGDASGLNTFLSRFVPNFPDTFVVRGQLVINPNFDQGTVEQPTEVFQRINTYFPLKFGLANGLLTESVPLDGESFPTDFTKDIKQSTVRVSATNHMPVSLGFSADLWGPTDPNNPFSPRALLMTIPTSGGARTIVAAPVDGNGSTTGDQLSEFRVTLTQSEMGLFNQADTMFIRLTAQTSGSGTLPVRYQATDFIRIKMSGNLVYTLKPEED